MPVRACSGGAALELSDRFARLAGVSADKDPLGRIDAQMDIVSTAHAIIYTPHRDLVARGLEDDVTGELLEESVRIALQQAPEIVRSAREVALDQAVHRLLDPASGAEARVAQAITRAEDAFADVLRRQQEIADELGGRGDGNRGA